MSGEASKSDMETEGEPMEVELPAVDEVLLAQVMELGFLEVRARKALMQGATNVEAALQWCIDHENDADIDAPISKSDAPAPVAKSIKCVATGRLFRSVEEAQRYAEKTGRTEFEECTEEKKPMTEEEKKKKVAELKELAAKRRAEREGIEKVEDVEHEKKRRQDGAKSQETKEQLEKAQRTREIDRVKKEKLDEKRERERLRAEIAKDKAERRARGGKLAGKLSADGYAPPVDHNTDRRDKLNVSKLSEGKVVTVAESKKEELSDPAKVDKAVATLFKYKTGGDGGVALKTLMAYVRNAIDKGDKDAKFLSIPTDGKAFKERVAPLIGGVALLKALGFVKNDAVLTLDPATRTANLALLTSSLNKLNAAYTAYVNGMPFPSDLSSL